MFTCKKCQKHRIKKQETIPKMWKQKLSNQALLRVQTGCSATTCPERVAATSWYGLRQRHGDEYTLLLLMLHFQLSVHVCHVTQQHEYTLLLLMLHFQLSVNVCHFTQHVYTLLLLMLHFQLSVNVCHFTQHVYTLLLLTLYFQLSVNVCHFTQQQQQYYSLKMVNFLVAFMHSLIYTVSQKN